MIAKSQQKTHTRLLVGSLDVYTDVILTMGEPRTLFCTGFDANLNKHNLNSPLTTRL